jgi:recombination protein RecA
MPTNIDSIRAQQFDSFLKQMAKDKPGEVITLASNDRLNVDVIPTGAISLDMALGVGGFPRGRIIELFGPEMGGKTSLALSVAAQANKLGGRVGFIDAEYSLNRQHAVGMGVDEEKFVIYQPDSGEDGLDMVQKMVTSEAFDVVIVDSVAALIPKAELDGEIGDQQMALQARLMSKFMRLITGPLADTNTMLILVNQIRTNLRAYGSPDISTGGKAIKFYAAVRIKIRTTSSKKIMTGGVAVGQTCIATVVKNKVAAPHREAEYDLIFGKSIDGDGGLLAACEQLGIVTRAGSSYTDVTTGERLGVGKNTVKERLSEDPELKARLVREVYASLQPEKTSAQANEEEEVGGDSDREASDSED